MLSIVVPTYNEAANIPVLLQRLKAALQTVEYEVLIVDDHSPDETVEVVRSLVADHPLLLLQPSDRPRDLSLAVIDGALAARSDSILVMDADLSHPAEMIPSMFASLKRSPDSFVVGSRYVSGGRFDRNWSLWRFLNSQVATLLSRPLVDCSDPMSGFFLFDRNQVDLNALRPIGYKIGLEIMVRGKFESIIEVPISFKDREIGESKMNLGQQIKYLRHLRRLYLFRFGTFAQFFHFGAVGASGFIVDVIFYYSLQFLGLPHLAARAASFWPAVSWNWFFNRLMTFGERTRRPKIRQWLEFVASSLVGFSINYGTYLALTTHVGFFDDYRFAALVTGVASAGLFNFAASTLFVYSDKRS